MGLVPRQRRAPGPQGNLLIDARDTWTTYDVSRRTGKINWELGGKDSSFTVQAAPGQSLDSANEIFAWQHDPEQVGPDTFTFFDNESSGTPLLPYSRAVTVRLNYRDQDGHAGRLGQPAGRPVGGLPGQRADHPQR